MCSSDLGELDKRRVSQLQLDTQLVYKALQYARRSNALVIAAAGNRRGGGESNWPLLPAAWELLGDKRLVNELQIVNGIAYVRGERMGPPAKWAAGPVRRQK